MTTTLGAHATAASWLSDPLRSTLRYAELLAEDIPAESFHDMPHPTMNHPAFCFGHLSLYPDKVLKLLGKNELVVEKEGWAELFDAPAPCVSQDGRYPGKEEIMAHFIHRNQTLLELLPQTTDDVFRRQNPFEGRFREMFPTIGSAVNFIVNSHNMLHLGQVSAWRRAVGLPAVM